MFRRAVTHTCTLAILMLAPVGSAAQDSYAEDEVLVVFKPGFEAKGAGKALGRHVLKLDRHYGRISRHSGRVIGLVKAKGIGTAKLIERLKADPEIESVEPNYFRHFCSSITSDTSFSKLWGLRNTGQTVNGSAGTSGSDTNFVAAWKLARSTSGEVVVGVVDSGVDITHPDLAANIWTNPGEIPGNGIDDDGNGFVDDVHGYDFASNTAVVADYDNHGTHIAGTIAAVKNGAGVIGVQYRAKILPLKIAASNGNLSSSAILNAYDYAIALKQSGINIVALNASFGSTFSSSSEQLAIGALRDNGIILCAAAGNGGDDSIGDNNDSLKFYPASYSISNIISVAAHAQSGDLASFSNYGANSVDLAAPGVNIYSTLPQNLVAKQSGVSAGAISHAAQELIFSGITPTASGVSGSIYHCGLGNPGDFPPGVSGNIALIQRGTLTFAAKVTNAMSAGAVAAIIYDNLDDPFGTGWTLGSAGSWIPAMQITKASGEAILAGLPASGTVSNYLDPTITYHFLGGTSMATPHVVGAVAFAAWNFPAETMSQRIARILGNVTPVAALAGKMSTGGRLNLLKMIDTESDGLPDWWETENFGSLAENAADDDDADGFSNLDEFLAGTDPDDPASHLSFSAFAALEDDSQTHFVLSFPSIEDRSYRIEWSESLQNGSWQTLGPPVTGTGAVLQVQDIDAIHAAARRFYRMSVLKD